MAFRIAACAVVGLFLSGCFDEGSSGSAAVEGSAEVFSSNGWAVETVDQSAGRGAWNSLAYDPSGNPAICYSGPGTVYDLLFARWNGSSWVSQTVDTGLLVTGSLAFSSSGMPMIAYCKDSKKGPNLLFAQWTGSSWSIQQVDANVAVRCSLVMDSAGQPAIAYIGNGVPGKNASAAGLKLARRNGSTWTKEVVDATANVARMSLGFDFAGTPAIAYARDASSAITGSDTLKFARKSGSSWSTEVVESGISNYGSSVSLAFDPATDHPAISHGGSTFNQSSQPAIRFVQWNGSSWVGETVVTTQSGQSAGRASLAFDADGNPILASEFLTSGQPVQTQIRFARRVGGVWEFEDIHTWAGALGAGAGDIPLVVNQGIPAVSFRAEDVLKYSRHDMP